MKTTIIIPARYKSSRYPGKPLAVVNGKPAILWTLEAGLKVPNVAGVYVATDDDRIKDTVEAAGGQVIMTSESCPNGTARAAEAAELLKLADEDIVINLQGDSLLTPPDFVTAVIEKLKADPQLDVATPILRCDLKTYLQFTQDRKAGRVGGTTAVINNKGHAMYFSKEVIPYLPNIDALTTTPVYHHVGLYGYRVKPLKAYSSMAMGPLEKAEGLEQLRFLENGKTMGTALVEARGRHFWELNNPEDVARIEEAFAGV